MNVMAGKINKLLFLSLSMVLTGCGNYFSVKLPYVIPNGPAAAANRELLTQIYILARVPAGREETVLTGLVAALVKPPVPALDGGAFTRRLAASFRRPGVSVTAYRTLREGNGTGADSFAARLNPASLLEVTLGAPSVSANKETRETVYTDKQKKRQILKTTVWVYSAHVTGLIKFSAYPAMEQRDLYSDTFVYTEERSDNSKSAADFYAANEEKLFSLVCTGIVRRYLGQPVLRYRQVFFKKGNAELKTAADHAQRGRWPQAKEVWEKQLHTPDGWRAAFNLAVAAETEKDYAAAAGLYRQAREKSGGDKEARIVGWAGIFSDLEYMLAVSTAPAPGGTSWFSLRTALLPFSEETASVSGPLMVREMLADAIKGAGYKLQDPAETDRILREHGYSDGGQLGAVAKGDLYKWLGVERVIYGNISDFGEVMAGLYNRRVVGGSFIMREEGAQAEVWTHRETVAKVKTPKNFASGMVSQLAKGLWERMKNKPLAEEADLFVKRVAESLPNKPK